MSTQLKLRRGTTAQHSTFTGAEGEITVDTTKDTVVVHDGSTAGGIPLAKESGSALSPASVTLSSGTANGVAYLNGSKVLTTGSALTFDGTELALTKAGSIYSRYSDTVNGTASYFGSISGVNWLGTTTNHPIAFNVNSAEQMRLTSTGLGIGTSSPNEAMTISRGSGASAATTYRGNGTTASGEFYVGHDPSAIAYLYNRSNTPMIFGTNNTECMRIDSSGNLGLGVPPSAWNTNYGIKAFDVSNGTFYGATSDVNMLHNAYFNSSNQWIYKTNAVASLYTQSSGYHTWHTAPSGTAGNAISFTQAMTLDASGNLGIGTTTLNVGLYGKAVTIAATAAAYGGIELSGTTGGAIDFQTNQTTRQVSLLGNSNGLQVYTNGGSGLTERMRIDSSGNVLVGTTSLFDTAKVSIQTNSNNGVVVRQNASGGYCYGARAESNGGTYYLMYFQANTTDVGGITSNGTGTTYGTSSDYRLKENIQPMQNALATVAQLNPVTYTWKVDGSDGQGFIAHELQVVVPDCVTGEKDAVDKDGKPVYQGVDTSFLVATLTKAIQEQQELINQLTARVAQLEGN